MFGAAFASGLHIFGVAVALASVTWRGVALLRASDADSDGAVVQRASDQALRADNIWGVSALMMWGSGLMRAFGGLEKGALFYEHNGLFFVKLGALALMMCVELVPMVVLLRWRLRRRRQPSFQDPVWARRLAFISFAEAAVVIGVLFLAPFMARGAWMLS
jgi:putative membrane protein